MELLLTLSYIPTWVYVVVGLLSVFYVYLTWNYNYWKKRGVPGKKPKLFLGTLKPFWISKMEDQDVECVKKYGRFYGGFEGPEIILFIADPDLIRQVTVKDFASLPNRRNFDLNDKCLNKMLSVLRNDEWKLVRNTLSPAFTTGKLKQMVSFIEEAVMSLTKSLETKVDTGEPTEMTNHFSVLTLDVIATSAFGMKLDCIQNPESEFVINARKSFRMPAWIAYLTFICPGIFKCVSKLPFKLFSNPFEYFINVGRKAIDVRVQNKQVKRRDFLEIMLDAQVQDESENEIKDFVSANRKTLTHDVIVAQTIVFILAGHETTANTFSFLSYELAMNPDIQTKLIAEIDEVMDECKGKLSYDIIASMQYLEMVVSEILRLHPPALRIERQCQAEKYVINGVTIDKGVIIQIPIYALHHDPEFYPNPEIFDPTRFSAENKAKRHPFTYIPFGAGPRNCIAMKFALMAIKTAIVLLLSKFRFSSWEKTDFPVTLLSSMGCHQPKSVNLQLQKRTDQPHFN